MAIVKYKDESGSWKEIPTLKGSPGATPNITVEVETLTAGSNATVSQSGTAEAPVIKIGIPKGDKGDKGDSGKDADTSTLVLKSGSRGELAGYEVPSVTSSAVTINQDSNDTTQVTGAVTITVSNGASSTTWTKVVGLLDASATISLGDAWVWQGGEVPTVAANSLLVLHWCHSFGLANLVTSE